MYAECTRRPPPATGRCGRIQANVWSKILCWAGPVRRRPRDLGWNDVGLADIAPERSGPTGARGGVRCSGCVRQVAGRDAVWGAPLAPRDGRRGRRSAGDVRVRPCRRVVDGHLHGRPLRPVHRPLDPGARGQLGGPGRSSRGCGHRRPGPGPDPACRCGDRRTVRGGRAARHGRDRDAAPGHCSCRDCRSNPAGDTLTHLKRRGARAGAAERPRPARVVAVVQACRLRVRR